MVRLDLPLGRVHPRRRDAEPRVDPVLFVKAAGPDERFLEGHFAAQILFGERRTLVRRMRLLTDEDDVAQITPDLERGELTRLDICCLPTVTNRDPMAPPSETMRLPI